MKSVIYILIAVFIGGIFVSAFPKTNSGSGQNITLECVSKNHSIELLNKSADILAHRLNDYGLKNVKLFINEQLSNIDIHFEKNVNLPDVISLLESKGQIAFFETLSRKEIINNIELTKDLTQMLNVPTANKEFDDNSGIFGYCTENNKTEAERLIKQHYAGKLREGINFYWSEQANKRGDFYLYVLKSHAALDNSSIAESVIKTDSTGKNAALMLEFNESGKSVWQEMTKRNMSRSIAIVLDKKVLCAPTVQAEITEGKCLITGDFSLDEMRRINALIKNEKLPLEFKTKP